MLNQDSEDEIRSRFAFELAIWLWQDELNPRVHCAFGNVWSISSEFIMLCISYDIGLLETVVSRLGCTILSDCPELLRNFLLSCQFIDRFTRNRCSKARMHQGQLRSKALKDIVARRRGHSPNINMILNNTFHKLAFAKRNKNILWNALSLWWTEEQTP